MAESKSAALPLGYAPSMAGSAVWHRTRRGANEKWRNGCKGRFRACGTPFWRLYVAALTGSWPCLRCRSVAQSGSALRSGRRGRRFKSCHSDQNLVGGLAIPRPYRAASPSLELKVVMCLRDDPAGRRHDQPIAIRRQNLPPAAPPVIPSADCGPG